MGKIGFFAHTTILTEARLYELLKSVIDSLASLSRDLKVFKVMIVCGRKGIRMRNLTLFELVALRSDEDHLSLFVLADSLHHLTNLRELLLARQTKAHNNCVCAFRENLRTCLEPLLPGRVPQLQFYGETFVCAEGYDREVGQAHRLSGL